MRIGVAEVNITPPLGTPMAGYAARVRGCEEVADPLYVRAMAIETADQRAALVTADVIGFPLPFVQAVRQQLWERLDLLPEQVLLTASHTHFGPLLTQGFYYQEEVPSEPDRLYLEMLQRQIVSAVQMAFARLEEAHVGWASVEASHFLYNRRPKRDGKLEMAFRYPERPEQYSWGPTDPEVQVLTFARPSGEPLALLVNYGCHPVAGADEEHFYHLSADYPGALTETVRRVLGVPVLFALAPCGDVNPRWRGIAARRRIGLGLAGATLKAYTLTEVEPVECFCVRRTEVELPLKPLPPSREAGLEALEEARRQGEREAIVKARRALWWLERLGEGTRTYPTEIQVFAWNHIALLGLPGEVFVEIGLSLKWSSPIENTLVVELCNDSCGYLPTDAAYDEGGYEPEWTAFAPGVETIIQREGLHLLSRVHGTMKR